MNPISIVEETLQFPNHAWKCFDDPKRSAQYGQYKLVRVLGYLRQQLSGTKLLLLTNMSIDTKTKRA